MEVAQCTYSIKKLILKNLICYTLPTCEKSIIPGTLQIKKVIAELNSCAIKHGGQPSGPLIMKTSVLRTDQLGNKTYTVYMQQLDMNIQDVEEPYIIEKSIVIPNCVHLLFKGNTEDFIYLFYKTISLIKYENMIPSKDTFTLFTPESNNNDCIAAELYIPVMF